MKIKTLVFSILAVLFIFTITSCDTDGTDEQTTFLDDLQQLDKEEIKEETDI